MVVEVAVPVWGQACHWSQTHGVAAGDPLLVLHVVAADRRRPPTNAGACQLAAIAVGFHSGRGG